MPGILELKVWRMLVTMLDKNNTEDCKSKMSCDTRPRGSGPAGLSATGACGSTEASCIACAPESATTTLCSTFISLSLEELTPSGSARDTESKAGTLGIGQGKSAKRDEVHERNNGTRDPTADNASPWKVIVLLAA